MRHKDAPSWLKHTLTAAGYIIRAYNNLYYHFNSVETPEKVILFFIFCIGISNNVFSYGFLMNFYIIITKVQEHNIRCCFLWKIRKYIVTINGEKCSCLLAFIQVNNFIAHQLFYFKKCLNCQQVCIKSC